MTAYSVLVETADGELLAATFLDIFAAKKYASTMCAGNRRIVKWAMLNSETVYEKSLDPNSYR